MKRRNNVSSFLKSGMPVTLAALAAVAVMQPNTAIAADQWVGGTIGALNDVATVGNYSPAPSSLTDGTQDLLFTTWQTSPTSFAPTALSGLISVDGLQFGASPSTRAMTAAWNPTYAGGAGITIGASGVTDYAQQSVTFSGATTLLSGSTQTWFDDGNTQTNTPITISGIFTGSGATLTKDGKAELAFTNTTNTFDANSVVNLKNGTLLFQSFAATGTSSMKGLINGAINITGTDVLNSNGQLNANTQLTLALGSATAIDGNFMAKITATTNIFTIGISTSSGANLDFTNYPNAILGAFGSAATYSGAITPGTNGYRIGGSIGNSLTVSSLLTGNNNLTLFNGNQTTVSNTGNNYTGALAVYGDTKFNTATAMGSPSSILLGPGQITINSGSFSTSAPITITATNGFTVNGNSLTLTGAVTETTTGGVGFGGFNSNTNILTLGGAADNTGLNVSFNGNNGVINLSKSGSAHAIGAGLTLNSTGEVANISGTNGDEISDNAFVKFTTSTTLNLNGNSEAVDVLLCGNLYGPSGTITSGISVAVTLTIGAGNGVTANNDVSLSPPTYAGYNGGNAAALFTGVIQNGSGTVSLTKIGTGSQILDNQQTYSGATTVNGGKLTLDFGKIAVSTSATADPILLNSPTLTLGGGTLQVTGRPDGSALTATTNTYSNGNTTITLSGTNNTNSMVPGQIVTGANIPGGDYVKYVISSNQFVLNQATTGSGTSVTVAAQSYASVQSFSSGTTLNSGATSSIIANSNGSTTGTTVNLNAITRNTGSTVDFTLPSVGAITTTTANTNFAGGQRTILGGYATVGGTTWAVSGSAATAGNITGLSSYDSSTPYTLAADVEAGGNSTSTSGAQTINSLRFNTAGAATASLGGNLNIATGGILETTNVGNSPVIINNNNITSGNGQDLVVIQNNTANSLTINSGITGGTGLTKSGAGTLLLNGPNNYTGPTNINSGNVTLGTTGAIGNNSAVILRNGSTLAFGTQSQINLQAGGVSASASSTEDAGLYPAPNAIDGSLSTRWSSTASDPQYLEVDMGQVFSSISSAKVAWETASGKNFVFEVATNPTGAPDGTSDNGWTVVGTFTNQTPVTNNGSTSNFSTYGLSGAGGEFLAMYGTARNTTFGYSIYEMQAFQSDASSTVNYAVGSLSSSDTTTSVQLLPNSVASVGGDNTSTTFAGTISGGGSLTKVGTGTLTLTNVETYSGKTSVGGGTLKLGSSASINSSSSIAVNAGGTLDVSSVSGYTLHQKLLAKTTGTATITGPLNTGGFTLDMQDGANIGTLAFTSPLTLSNSTLNFDIGSSLGSNDQITVAGAVTSAGTNTINLAALTGATSLVDGDYTLITATSGLNTSFTLGSASLMVGSNTYTLSLADSTATSEIISIGGGGGGAANLFFTGSAGNGIWDTANTTNFTAGSGAVAFHTGDNVTFDTANNTGFYTIAVASGGVAPKSMTVTGTTPYIFSGGNIGSISSSTSLTVDSGSSMTFDRGSGSRVTLELASLSNSGLIDLKNNTMLLHGADSTVAATIRGELQSGFNGGGWNGTSGIKSSSAAGSSLYTLGEMLSGGDLTVAYTYYGDTNLSGTIDGTDYSVIDTNNGLTAGGTWQTGDFNYDGTVDGSDYSLIDNAFNMQNGGDAVMAAQVAVNTSEIAGGSAAVPEPASLGLLGIGAMSLLNRRRRKI